MPLNDFEIQGQLGKGAFATVHKCRRKLDGKVYALKKIEMKNLPQKDRINALNEIRILASVSGLNIIEYKEAFYDEDSECLCIIMEFANGGDLMSKIVKHKDDTTIFEEKDIWKYAFQMLKGLKTLHDAKILHRDIKSANIFLCDGVAKIGDLNISKLLQTGMATTQTGTPYYTCPQIWKDIAYSYKSDVWSLGCVIYELCMLKPPFRAQQFQGLYKKVISGVYQRISFVYTSGLSLFISRCLTVDEHKRASVDELLNFPFFKNFSIGRISLEIENNMMLQTMEFPQNLADINNIVPGPQYQRRPKKKPKTVVILESRDEEIREAQNAMHQTLGKILVGGKKGGVRSEKLIPLSNNILPRSCKQLERPASPQKQANVRIRSVQKSQTRLIN